MMEKIKTLLEMSSSDKALHLLWSYLVASISLWLFGIFGLALPIIVGAGKELYDKYYGSGWSKEDLVADSIGIALATLIWML